MRYEEIQGFIERVGLCQTRDLVEAGIHYRQLKRAMDEKTVHPVTVSGHGEVPGWYASPEVAADDCGRLKLVLASRMTGGVVAFEYAALQHQMISEGRASLTMLVGHGCTRSPPGLDIVRVRTRNPDLLVTGVVPGRTESGLEFSMTSEARTVVDLLRIRDKRWEGRHASEALDAFLEEGGEPAELNSLARRLGFDADRGLMEMIENASRGYDAGRPRR